MAALLKHIYNQDFFKAFTNVLQKNVEGFVKHSFLDNIYDHDWDKRELKQRMRHITVVLNKHLTSDFQANAKTLVKLIPSLLKAGFKADNLEFIFFPDFIEVYGLDNYEDSIHAFERITQFVTCEFAVRPFIIKYPKKMMAQMLRWSKHAHPMVRRLSSEGYRPRLPWAMALPALKENPTPIIPILEILKDDESESVRRSVANNLNDISKDHPDILIKLAKQWQGKSENVNKVIKHACRTLLKQGNLQVMELFGFGSIQRIEILDFEILTPKVKIGDHLEFIFKLRNSDHFTAKLRLEYGLYFQKANGTLSRKVFTISEKEYAENSTTSIHRKQSFRIITTRKYHLGQHQVSIIINGQELEKSDFELVA